MADEGVAAWIGAIAGVGALGFAAWVFFGGNFAPNRIDDIKGCNGFLIQEKPAISVGKSVSESVEQKYLQDKILACRDELQKNSKNAVAHTNIGEASRRLGNLPIALSSQQNAVVLDPTLQEAKLGLALVQATMGQLEEANETIRTALAQKERVVLKM